MTSTTRIGIMVSAVVAVVLQIFVAPHIAVLSAVPNFMVAVCMVAAVLQPFGFGCLLPFVMGLLFDLISGGPVGAMAFSLTAFSVGAAWFFGRVNNDTLFMALVSLAVGLLLVEVAYGVFCLLLGYTAGVFEAFAYRIAPCFLYDLVIAVILYLLAVRFLKEDGIVQSEIRQLH